LFFVNTAVALVRLVLLTVNTHGFTALALHGPAVQFVNEYPVPGVAVKLTEVPEANVVEHTLGGAGFPQLISVAIVGVEVLVSVPFPVNATVKLLVCAVNTAVTVCAAPIVTPHFAGCPVGIAHGPLQLVKFEVGFGSAVSVSMDPLNTFCVQTPAGVLVPVSVQSIAVPVPPMFPSTIPPPVAPAPGITFSAKLPAPLLNVAEISVFAVIVNEHVVAVPEHVVIPHPPNTEQAPGASVKSTAVPIE
jgi:hypothetical protein